MTRKYELDWLRVILFGLLVPYHAALGFVSYGADVYGFANDELGGVGLELILDWSHSWRIFALFMISGVGTWFASRKGAGLGFVLSRLHRLGLPLIGWIGFAALAVFAFGMPLEAFVWLSDQETGWRAIEYVDFWHLWFLKNLLIYTLICVPLLLWPRALSYTGDTFFRPVLVIAIGMFVLNPLFEPLLEMGLGLDGDDFYNFMGFVLGIWVGANAAKALGWMSRWRWFLLLSGTASYPLTLTFQLAYYDVIADAQSVGSLYGEVQYLAWHAVRPVNAMIWGMGIFGLASRVLNKPSRALSRLTKLVFPLYVFHMPISMAGLGIAAQLQYPWQIEMWAIIIVTLVLSGLLALVAERLGRAAYLFGATPRV